MIDTLLGGLLNEVGGTGAIGDDGSVNRPAADRIETVDSEEGPAALLGGGQEFVVTEYLTPEDETATETATVTETATETDTVTATETATETDTVTATETATVTDTVTATETATETDTITATETATQTATATATAPVVDVGPAPVFDTPVVVPVVPNANSVNLPLGVAIPGL